MRFVIVSGMSGAGKTTALKNLEDIGYFCVDNLPVLLIEKFAEISRDSNFKKNKVAIGIDIRSGDALGDLTGVLNRLREDHFTYEILFLDASDEVLVKRFNETRRRHPLSGDGRTEDGIRLERQRIDFLRKTADYTIDTSHLLTRELKREIERIFLSSGTYTNMIVTLLSFGYKFGVPQDVNYVFDTRLLPNPYYVPELRQKTGNDEDVQKYVITGQVAEAYLNRVRQFITFLVPEYIRQETVHQMIFAFGCTGGRHRSVTVANILKEQLSELPCSVRVFHRDIANDAYVKRER